MFCFSDSSKVPIQTYISFESLKEKTEKSIENTLSMNKTDLLYPLQFTEAYKQFYFLDDLMVARCLRVAGIIASKTMSGFLIFKFSNKVKVV